MTPSMPTWWTPAEAAAELGLTRAQLQYRTRVGQLPCIRFGHTDPEARRGTTTRYDVAAIQDQGEARPPRAWAETPATAETLAAWLRIDAKTLRRAIRLGQIRSDRSPTARRAPHAFSRKTVLAFLDAYTPPLSRDPR